MARERFEPPCRLAAGRTARAPDGRHRGLLACPRVPQMRSQASVRGDEHVRATWRPPWDQPARRAGPDQGARPFRRTSAGYGAGRGALRRVAGRRRCCRASRVIRHHRAAGVRPGFVGRPGRRADLAGRGRGRPQQAGLHVCEPMPTGEPRRCGGGQPGSIIRHRHVEDELHSPAGERPARRLPPDSARQQAPVGNGQVQPAGQTRGAEAGEDRRTFKGSHADQDSRHEGDCCRCDLHHHRQGHRPRVRGTREHRRLRERHDRLEQRDNCSRRYVQHPGEP